MPYTIEYWKHGTAILEYQLEEALKATVADMPMGMDPKFFHSWKMTKTEAFRHALDMMGNYE